MATIEERATKHSKNDPMTKITLSATISNIVKDAYIAGATEQRQIDIDKAVEWLRENIRPWYKFSIDTFRKAMTKED